MKPLLFLCENKGGGKSGTFLAAVWQTAWEKKFLIPNPKHSLILCSSLFPSICVYQSDWRWRFPTHKKRNGSFFKYLWTATAPRLQGKKFLFFFSFLSFLLAPELDFVLCVCINSVFLWNWTAHSLIPLFSFFLFLFEIANCRPLQFCTTGLFPPPSFEPQIQIQNLDCWPLLVF